MHFWMASADRAQDCLRRLSSDADFLHLQVTATRLSYDPSAWLLCTVCKPPRSLHHTLAG